MFYATSLFPIDTIDDRQTRAEVINEQLERLARERTRLLRAQQERREGHLLTPLATETTGDVVMVMVDPGNGAQVAEDIARMLAG